jgi:hypothetical protein
MLEVLTQTSTRDLLIEVANLLSMNKPKDPSLQLQAGVADFLLAMPSRTMCRGISVLCLSLNTAPSLLS